MRKGLGIGTGKKGYYNLQSHDPVVHSMSAKGIKSTSGVPMGNVPKSDNFRLQYKELDKDELSYQDKKGLIKEIARNVSNGVKWAIEWEKEHLPAQEEWVKKEYESAKEKIRKGFDNPKEVTTKAKDNQDVKDELDTNDDGTPDIEYEELENVNQGIKSELKDIDLDDNGVADAHEDGTFRLHDDDEVDTSTTTINKKGFIQKAKDKIDSEIEKRKIERDNLQTLSDSRLKELAIKEGRNFFGGMNKYESELIEREKNKLRLKYEVEKERELLKNELAKVRKSEKERATGNSSGDVLGFIKF